MRAFINISGTAAGIAGTLACILAVVMRLGGNHYLLGTEVAQWLVGGIALLAMGCFAKLWVLTSG